MAQVQAPISGPVVPDATTLFCRHSFHALGTDLEVAVVPVAARADCVDQDLALVEAQCLAFQHQFSRFEADSELSQLNRRAGKWVEIHPRLAEVLQLAAAAHHQSGGLFHPGMGRQLSQLGYDKSFELVRDAAMPAQRQQTAQAGALYELRHWEGIHWAKLPPGMQLDLGGIAKGWIVEQGARLLQQLGYRDFVYNAGGDMVCSGRFGDRPWRIGIEHPRDPAVNALVLELHSTCLATSGTYRRNWQLAEGTAHHILNPQTGESAVTDVASCTVLHQSLVAAEWMAKSALILGASDGLDWLKNQPSVRGFVVITNTGEVIHSWNSSTNAPASRC